MTPEGDEITADGIRIAQPDGAGPAALEAARVAVEKSERELQRAASRLTTAQRAFDDAREAERESLELLEAAEAELAGFTEALAIADLRCVMHVIKLVVATNLIAQPINTLCGVVCHTRLVYTPAVADLQGQARADRSGWLNRRHCRRPWL